MPLLSPPLLRGLPDVVPVSMRTNKQLSINMRPHRPLVRKEGRTQDFSVILCLAQVPHNMRDCLFVVIIVTFPFISLCVYVG